MDSRHLSSRIIAPAFVQFARPFIARYDPVEVLKERVAPVPVEVGLTVEVWKANIVYIPIIAPMEIKNPESTFESKVVPNPKIRFLIKGFIEKKGKK